jgi:putative membrane protein
MKLPQIVLFTLFFAGILTSKFQAEFSYPIISIMAMIGFSIPAYIGVTKITSWKNSLLLFVLIGLFALSFETLAIITGFPYSPFSYGGDLGPKLFNITPVTIFIGWTPMVIGSLALANTVWKRYHFLMAILTLIVVDLVVDPGATALGFWIWEDHPWTYAGVPMQNFFGWGISGAIGIWITQRFIKTKSHPLILQGLLTITIFWTGVVVWQQLWVPSLIGLTLGGFIHKSIAQTRKTP